MISEDLTNRGKNRYIVLLALSTQVAWLSVYLYYGIGIAASIIIGILLLFLPLVNLRLGLVILLFFFIVVNQPLDARFQYRGILVQDIFFLWLISAWLFSAVIKGEISPRRPSPLTLSLLLFLFVGIIATLLGFYFFNRTISILREVRELLYFSTYFIVLSCVKEKRHIYFIVIGLITAINLFAIESIYMTTLQLASGLFGFRYVKPTSVYLVMGLIMSISLLLFGKPGKKESLLLSLSLVLPGVALILSLTRGYWLGLIAGMVFIFLFVSRKKKIILFLSSLFLAFIGLWISSRVTGISFAELFTNVVLRAHTIEYFAYDPSVLARFAEVETIIREIVPNHIVFGRGLGASIYLFKIDRGMWMNWEFIHNNYFEILFKMGIVGIFAYMLKVWMFFKEGFVSIRKTREPFYKGICYGILASYFAFMVISMTSGCILSIDTALTIGMLMGIVDIIHRTETEKNGTF